jgi:hypothetical protein
MTAQQSVMRTTLSRFNLRLMINLSALNPSSANAAKNPDAMLRHASSKPAAPAHQRQEKKRVQGQSPDCDQGKE